MPKDSLQQGIEEEGISIYTIKLIFDEIQKISNRIPLLPHNERDDIAVLNF